MHKHSETGMKGLMTHPVAELPLLLAAIDVALASDLGADVARAAVFDADAAEEVPGVVVSIRAEMLEEALASLDEVEGVDGGLFQRVVIDVGGLSCWAYHWPESTEAFHRIQRWPRGGEL